jgi:ribonucleoside-diphosphate reductase alpha chain
MLREDLPEKYKKRLAKVNLTENAVSVLRERYLKKDQYKKANETPEDMFWRVAYNIASAEVPEKDRKSEKANEVVLEWAVRFYNAMARCEFMPNSPTLMNAGRTLQQLAGCFVLPLGDSVDDIFLGVTNGAKVHKSGGGTGFDFSCLRPKGDTVSTSHGTSSGPLPFMAVFNQATDSINQGGFRRGANMGVMRVDHPDIIEFIGIKQDLTKMNNFNLSVAVTDKFLEALEKGQDYDLINPRTKKAEGKLSAQAVFDLIVACAWNRGEPGVIFIDRINKDNPTPKVGKICATNPCGEQPLLPYEACNLGSINLSKFYDPETDGIDWDSLDIAVETAVRFLDNVVTMGKFPLPEIQEMVRGNRKIGLGVMGWADLLFYLKLPYNSRAATKLAEEVMEFINTRGHEVSKALGKEKGPFPNIDKSIYKGTTMRNATITTIAPTGTISIIAGCSSGIEPLFSFVFKRNILEKDQQIMEVHPFFKSVAVQHGFASEELFERIYEEGSLQHIEEVPPDIKALFVCAHDVSPEWHVRMQAAFQHHVDNAVSKTVNFPFVASEEDIAKVFKLAIELGVKGVTVYRNGSYPDQPMALKDKEDDDQEVQCPEPLPRPAKVLGETTKIKTGCGSMFVTINHIGGAAFEVFANVGKAGGCLASQNQAFGRLISLALRCGVRPEEVLDQIEGIQCPKMGMDPEFGPVRSCVDGIAHVLRRFIEDNAAKVDNHAILFKLRDAEHGLCPACGAPLHLDDEDRKVCPACKWSQDRD